MSQDSTTRILVDFTEEQHFLNLLGPNNTLRVGRPPNSAALSFQPSSGTRVHWMLKKTESSLPGKASS